MSNISTNRWDDKSNWRNLTAKRVIFCRFGRRPRHLNRQRRRWALTPKTKRAAVLRPEREADYCRFIVRVLKHLQARKLPIPFALSAQNEPNYAPELWNGTQLSPAQWQRLTIEMRAQLDKSGFKNIEIIGPEGGSYRDSVAFVGGVAASALGDEKFNRALGGYAFHGYTLFLNINRIWIIARSRARNATRGQTDLAERNGRFRTTNPTRSITSCKPRNGWAAKPRSFRAIIGVGGRAITRVFPKAKFLIAGPDDNDLHISKTYYFLKFLWKNAPKGSVVHRVESSDAEISGFNAERVQCVAFENGARQTVLLVNPTDKIKAVELRGLTAATATPYLTDKSRDMETQAPIAVVNGAANWTLPARAVCVITTR